MVVAMKRPSSSSVDLLPSQTEGADLYLPAVQRKDRAWAMRLGNTPGQVLAQCHQGAWQTQLHLVKT